MAYTLIPEAIHRKGLHNHLVLSGTPGGQVAIGGTGVTDKLTLQGTSANGTSSSKAIVAQVGNNGATEALTILNTSQIGVRATAPTARLHIGAGLTSAGYAPVKLTAGSILSSVENGAIEYDGSRLFFTVASHRRFFNVASDSTLVTVTATAALVYTNLSVISFNANEAVVGKVWRFSYCGLITQVGALDQVTLRWRIGGTTIIDFQLAAGIIADMPYTVEAMSTMRTIGAAGTVSHVVRIITPRETATVVIESVAFNTTAIQAAYLAANWSAAGNSCKMTQSMLEVLS